MWDIKTRVLQEERQWVSRLPGIKATFSFPFFFSLPPLAEPLPPSISPRVNSKATSWGKGFRVMVTDTAGNQRWHSVGTSLMPSSHAANTTPPTPNRLERGFSICTRNSSSRYLNIWSYFWLFLDIMCVSPYVGEMSDSGELFLYLQRRWLILFPGMRF